MTTANNALQIIETARGRGALIYSAPNLQTPPLFKVEVTEIASKPEEFHNIQGKYMPSKAVLDRISDAAGINFIEANCTVTSETRDDALAPKRTVFIGRAQGKVRISDGSWRESTVEEYEFDPTLRAMAEGGSKSKELEYMKVGRMRASTGARLRVIRQLTGMPVTLTKADTEKPLVFSRIVQNTDYILATPEGRQMAVAQALGITPQLYGPRPAQIEAPSEPRPERNVTHSGDDFDPAPGADFDIEPDPIVMKKATILDLLAKYNGKLNASAAEKAKACAENPESPESDLDYYLDAIKGALARQGIILGSAA